MNKKPTKISKPITEDYLNVRLKIFKDELKEEIVEESKIYKDQVFTKLDQIIGQLDNLRVDNEVGANQTSELWDKAENHEKRIASLEQRQSA